MHQQKSQPFPCENSRTKSGQVFLDSFFVVKEGSGAFVTPQIISLYRFASAFTKSRALRFFFDGGRLQLDRPLRLWRCFRGIFCLH